ncbi:MAG: HNH endonuclease [Anaerolineae bacterium]|nr:HNH endonuclease [Anaerolineae bacterium]
MHYRDFLDEMELAEALRSINGRAKALGKQGVISLEALRDRILECAGRCEWCAESVLHQPIEIDHIISLSSGGSHTPQNLAVACPACNRAKSSKHPVRFAQETFARTGLRTALIDRVLTHYEAEATVQRSFFDVPETPAPENPPDDEPGEDPPPYIWKR